MYKYFFLFCVIIRVIHFKFSGFDSTFCCDISRYLDTSKNIIEGNYNLINELFITAPIYSYYLALLRLIDDKNFLNLLITSQIIISSIGVIYIMKISRLLFDDKNTEIITGIVFSLYPNTFFYAHMVAQETIFEFFFIISCFYFCKFTNNNKIKYLLFFLLFVTLALLTKSHISIIIILLLLSIVIVSQTIKRKLQNILISILVIGIITFPYGYYNYVKNKIYVISSSGPGMYMSLSHNDNIYNFLVEISSLEELKNKNSINLFPVQDKSIEKMNMKEKENFWKKDALQWIENNPKKFIKMKMYNFFHFIFPGVNINHYTFNKWLISFIISAPVYIGAYVAIYKCVRINIKKHLLILSCFIGMIIFSTIFMPVDRFTYVTLEPLFIVYFGYFIKKLFDEQINIKSKSY
jgi:hypothetical protein